MHAVCILNALLHRDLLSDWFSDGDLVDRQLYSVGPISHFGECMAVNRVIVDNTLNVTHRRLLAVRIKYIFKTCANTVLWYKCRYDCNLFRDREDFKKINENNVFNERIIIFVRVLMCF